MNMLFFVIFILGLASPALAQEINDSSFAIAKMPTVVLNTPDFLEVFGGKNRKTLSKDESGLIKEVEFIALPTTVFEIKEVIKKDKLKIFRVETKDYPYSNKGYFIDSRFVYQATNKPKDRLKKLPRFSKIIDRLIGSKGCDYIWGGNWSEGIKDLLAFYPPAKGLDYKTKQQWMLKGVDCSGLLYEATNGFTPRNTDQLINFGQGLTIEGVNAKQIKKKLKSLDLIVWDGHVIIVLDNDHVIESRQWYQIDNKKEPGGVRVRRTIDVLEEVLRTRRPVNDYYLNKEKNKFVIRRWYKL